ncbi:hypothetical protein Thiowin_00209 [Thiorhodovibrio winogradskyi]|uniref:Uncharacterized protein n=1 Tax=Thiorhodovibrio winogradskyi TaxID=77007 RepID=A0ABZ0S3T2_9GAMM
MHSENRLKHPILLSIDSFAIGSQVTRLAPRILGR